MLLIRSVWCESILPTWTLEDRMGGKSSMPSNIETWRPLLWPFKLPLHVVPFFTQEGSSPISLEVGSVIKMRPFYCPPTWAGKWRERFTGSRLGPKTDFPNLVKSKCPDAFSLGFVCVRCVQFAFERCRFDVDRPFKMSET